MNLRPILIVVITFSNLLSFSLKAAESCKIESKKHFSKLIDQVIIIGAGVNGLGAARSFIENGVPPGHISIIEKNSQAGGKVSSISYKGRSYELGATILLPGIYQEIEKLRDEFGLKTRVMPYPLKLTPPSLELKEQLDRYLTRYAKDWNQENIKNGYHLLAEDGLKHIHPDLKLSWNKFIKKNHYELINERMTDFLFQAGYTDSSDTTEASLIVRFLSPNLIKSLFFKDKKCEFFGGNGWQELWIKTALDLSRKGVKFYYNYQVEKITRSSKEKLLVEGKERGMNFQLKADQVLYTADLSYLTEILTDIRQCESILLKKIIHKNLFSVIIEKIENNTKVMNSKIIKPITFSVYAVPPYKEVNVLNLYLFDNLNATEQTIRNGLVDYYRQSNNKIKIVALKKWQHFPRILGDTEIGFNDLLKLEGHKGLWLSGEIFSFSTVNSSYKNGKFFASEIVKNQL
jgi:hypothetical protein